MAELLASFPAAVEHAIRQGNLAPHQAAAFVQAWDRLSEEDKRLFSDTWRAAGSPAVAPPKPPKPSNPLAGFPWFSQWDNGPEGWRQCQTSSIAMALRFLGVLSARENDLHYLDVVRRYGDTTVQKWHVCALAELKAPGRFVQNCSAAQMRAEITAGRPVVAGMLHHGPVTAPSGGGHYVAVYGFDDAAKAWIVNDPYGEQDLVNGGWVQIGGDAGRAQRYSYQNFNPRWLVEGSQSGWAWLFDR